ncbi:helicase HerA-like domain-containing protein [Shewanella morhuae]|uniref:Ornithine/acetylornithine aminotransferase n=1 Tax=Shewanella morhuae TaxID=365591 RepID=A0A380B4K7_9GAMM|nr:helicase HerA-like domain-containing protein [Shewanella morhuae]SUI92561.1 Ornithine/acetylornithine aminotransferase [Shewanella morhuae]
MNTLLIGKGEQQAHLNLKYANRHGLIAGATGTGKTVSLMSIAEGFSRQGVPVFITDVKGDISGLAMAGTANEKLLQRVAQIGIEGYQNEANPVVLWDLAGIQGHPLRTTISEMGPTLLGRILELNDTQSSILDIVFQLADDQGLLLLDLDDLRAMLALVAEERKEISAKYGLISAQSLAAIQRSVLGLERDGGKDFFGEPALQLEDLMRTNLQGRGIINLLAANKLILTPRLYSSFLLWLLSELFENLPEVGDPEKPKLVFFIDEAHLLFEGCPLSLLKRVEQIMRLIRSKGVGVYFCSQFPDDIPSEILGQLGNRIQHALRAYTPRDQKAVKTAAETFVPNPKLVVSEVISQLAVGEALVSMLADKGVPTMVERALIAPPRCRMGPATNEELQQVRAQSPIGGKYDNAINRESAYELLNQRRSGNATSNTTATANDAQTGQKTEDQGWFSELIFGNKRRQGLAQTLSKQAARTVGSQLGKQILRGILGGILGKSSRR